MSRADTFVSFYTANEEEYPEGEVTEVERPGQIEASTGEQIREDAAAESLYPTSTVSENLG